MTGSTKSSNGPKWPISDVFWDLTTKECYSAHFVVQPRNDKRRFVRHIGTDNPTIENGILAAGINRISGIGREGNNR